jgi:phosphoglycerol transferase MdoB-like AlkP superfamily enzyme
VYGTKADITGNVFDVMRAFWVGFRFDLVVSSYAMLLPFVLFFSVLFVPSKFIKYQSFVTNFAFYYSLFAGLIFLIVSLIDFYFYKFFQYHINILFFGIVNDDTLAVLKSVWTDYPFIRIMLFILIIMWLYWYLLKKKIFNRTHNCPISHPVVKTLFVVLLFLVYGISMRGSFNMFPLGTENGIICENNFVNTLAVNGVFSLKDAISEKNDQDIDTDIDKRLKENGFSTIEEPLSIYLEKNIQPSENPEMQLIAHTRQDSFLRQNPPNVVFIQMESMSSYFLEFHSSTFNMLGSLEAQLPECILFRNFLSSTNGTIGSLLNLMVNSPLQSPISQSTYMNCKLSSSVAKPYKEAGYFTSFITGAEIGWRNLDKFVPNQYFDATEGAEVLAKKINNASRNEWGVYDEYLFDRMYQVLMQSNGKPQFIFAMTTTNHTPFSIPAHYKPYPVTMPDYILKNLKATPDIAQRNFTDYQYANDCLGRFIEMVRNSPLGQNTIIAASGDHNTRQLFNFSSNQILQKLSVPFLLYVPEKYLKHCNIDTSRFGSHKDIFPTLFNLSLSNAAYLKSGVNLLDTSANNNFGIINCNVAINKYGCVDLDTRLYYKWEKSGSKLMTPTTLEETPQLKNLLLKSKAFKSVLTFSLQTDLLHYQK